ncbi:MAG: hypothetical protein PPP58_05185 [Natronomonas sp.]
MLPRTDDGKIPGWFKGITLLAGTISLAGITDRLLTAAGYEVLGVYVWAVCYAGALLLIWMVWLRDIELTGPANG